MPLRKLLKTTLVGTIVATMALPFLTPLPRSAGFGSSLLSDVHFFLPQLSSSSSQAQGRPNAAQQQQQQQQQQQVAVAASAAANVTPTLHVLSYSIYGTDPRYLEGMISTARLVPTIYGPDWQVRIHHDATVPVPLLDELQSLPNVKLINVNLAYNPWVKDSCNPMSWRFLVASDPTVKAYVIRDADSRPSRREKMAVDEWLASGRGFHIMRDHPLHHPSGFAVMLGGMWGGLRRAVPNMERIMRDYYFGRSKADTNKYGEDQRFLWDKIVPLARDDCYQHDSYYCRETGGVAFPDVTGDDADDGSSKNKQQRQRDTFVGDAFLAKDAFRSVRESKAENKAEYAARMKLRTYACMARSEQRARFDDCVKFRRERIDGAMRGKFNGTATSGTATTSGAATGSAAAAMAASLDTSFVGTMKKDMTYSQSNICPAKKTTGMMNVGLRKNAGIRIAKKKQAEAKKGKESGAKVQR